MIERIDRAWRLVATAIAFSSFGIGGLILRLVYFPLLQWLVREPAGAARLAIHYVFRGFIGWMKFLGILRYRITGVERLHRPGLLILANHPSLLDVVFLISLVRNANCVVKASLARNPFTRGPVLATNYICNDSGVGLVDDCIASVKAGHNLIIFPEGTRTPMDGNMQLQRGAANIAVRGPCNITPVLIRVEPRSLTKGLPWWKIPPRRMLFTIDVREDIAVAPFLERAGNEPALAARQLTEFLRDYFTKEAGPHAGA